VARPLRIEYPGAFYHVTARGNEQKDIFKSQRDREKFLSRKHRGQPLTQRKHRGQPLTQDISENQVHGPRLVSCQGLTP
jgi:hypothetical protein